MKKNIIKYAPMALMLMSGASANALIDLGNILGGLSGNSGSTTGNVISSLTSIFSSDKQATANNIVGTWSYDSPAIVFDSDDLLTKTGAALAASKIETKL